MFGWDDLIGAIVGGAAGLFGADAQSDAAVKASALQATAAKEAAERQYQAASEANNLQGWMFAQNLNTQQPYLSVGNTALYALRDLLGLKASSMPVYGMGTGPQSGAVSGATAGTPSIGSLNLDIPSMRSWLEQQQKAKPTYLAGTGIDELLDPETPMGKIALDQYNKYVVEPAVRSALQATGLSGNALNTAVENAVSGKGISSSQAMYPMVTGTKEPGESGLPEDMYGSLLQDFAYQDFDQKNWQDPGYDFRLAEGQKALERSAAARGGLKSGGTLKALTDYAQGMASQEYQNSYNRYDTDYRRAFDTFNANKTNLFNRLASMAGVGQQTATTLGSAGQRYASDVGNTSTTAAARAGDLNTDAAAARASGYVGSANAWNDYLSGLGGLFKN